MGDKTGRNVSANFAHTIWLEPLLGVKKTLKHAFVKEHETHRLRDDDVHQLWEVNLLYLARDYTDTIGQQVTMYECLKTRTQKSRSSANAEGPREHALS